MSRAVRPNSSPTPARRRLPPGRRRSRPGAALAAAALTALAIAFSLAAAPPSDKALELRNRGIAALENEQPAEAEAAFRELTGLLPGDPLGWADLAIAALRQQKFDDARTAIARGLERAPDDPRLLAIAGEIAQWSGEQDRALELFRRAAAGAPEDPETQFTLYRLATILPGEAAEKAAGEALGRLERLRPDNLVVLLQSGQRARARGDREAASRAFLRVRELVWQAPQAEPLVEQILEALSAGDLEAARVPAIRLENVLKIAPMYRESQRELATGIQGVPIVRFRDEPPAKVFGDPVAVVFRGSRLAEGATAAVEAADFDGDGGPEIARLTAGAAPRLEILAPPDWRATASFPAAGLDRLLVADLDNDGRLDLVGLGSGAVRAWRGVESGFEDATEGFGLAAARGPAAEVIDFDIEGDLDLVTGGAGGLELYRNALTGPLEPVGGRVFPDLGPLLGSSPVNALVASDLDRDGDLDLALGHAGGVARLDNLRQGKFSVAPAPGHDGPARALASADLDGDGRPDLAVAGRGLAFYRNTGGGFEAWNLGGGLATSAEFGEVVALDADNDGRLDLAVAGERALAVLAGRPGDRVEFLTLEAAPAGAADLEAVDLDGDGDLDLLAATGDGLFRLDNDGGNRNRWLAVRLRGLDKGNSKNNLFGLGSTLEVVAGAAYQFREAREEVTHFGLGGVDRPELLRVVWTNGVPQNRLEPAARQTIVEEQLLKGSCPFLYAWTGDGVEFVTDLLWGSPAGLPVAEGVWAGADPSELVAVPGAAPRGGVYDLRITEELWEAAFFDLARLWVVDHPADVEVASSLKILPGRQIEERVLASRDVRPLASAWDARGRDVTARVARRDEIYADGWEASPYQGVAARPWSFTFDLGAAPGTPVRLLLDGWIFPSDASLNLALDQRADLAPQAPRLEVETAAGWQVLVAETGFPAGKTKTMVVDTPPLPAGARRLRLVSNLWLSWDRIAWSAAPDDGAAVVVARLVPARAELGFRGFSAPRRAAPNAPHAFDYATVSTDSPWLPFPGRYTRYGDVRELLVAADDRSVILAAGDELELAFDARELPPTAPGFRRTVFLESHGWDKDADRNTWAAEGVEPLPFRGMSGYPYGSGEAFPDTPAHRDYLESWLTRVVEAPPPGLPARRGPAPAASAPRP